MGKIIEFKKFSKKINTENLHTQSFSIDIFPENDLMYIRKELEINLDEIDMILNCVYKQILINEKLITATEDDFEKLTYLKDFNDKLQDIIYFLTNSSYNDPIIININFLEFKYLMGTLQLELDVLKETQAAAQDHNSLDVLDFLFNRLLPSYNSWKKDIFKS
ncbi:hypothetical protein [Clostridium thailandense]|uniref:hypothetical protein n=1 Tax=Clostridium thailandense TaxID=2794346 RepID=UPI00398921C2